MHYSRRRPGGRIPARVVSSGCAFAALLLLLGTSAASRALAAEEGAEDKGPPKPVDQVFEVPQDHLKLTATYYASPKKDPDELKEAVPVILLHDYKGSRKDLAATAAYLQELGHAVLVPDLRGHGDSTTFAPDPRRGGQVLPPLSADRFGPRDFTAMVYGDMPTLKAFLMKEHNKQKLNIEKLVVVGVGMSASVAANFAAIDYARRQLPGRKQGRDVRGVVMISPEYGYRGLPLTSFLQSTNRLPAGSWQKILHDPKDGISILLLVGKDDPKALKEVDRIEKELKMNHPAADDAKLEDRSLIKLPMDTKLQGIELLNAPLEGGGPPTKVAKNIAYFIRIKADENAAHPWADRSGPFGN